MVYTLRRPAARAVLLDPDRRVFLMRAADPADPTKPPWWEIPGGGIDYGEDSAAAAKRELFEEAGFRDVEVGPCIWTQYVEFDFAGLHFESDEKIHVAYIAEATDWNPQGLEMFEAMAFKGGRWWELDELLASDEPVLPTRLREFLPAIVADELPVEPIDISPPLESPPPS